MNPPAAPAGLIPRDRAARNRSPFVRESHHLSPVPRSTLSLHHAVRHSGQDPRMDAATAASQILRWKHRSICRRIHWPKSCCVVSSYCYSSNPPPTRRSQTRLPSTVESVTVIVDCVATPPPYAAFAGRRIAAHHAAIERHRPDGEHAAASHRPRVPLSQSSRRRASSVPTVIDRIAPPDATCGVGPARLLTPVVLPLASVNPSISKSPAVAVMLKTRDCCWALTVINSAPGPSMLRPP